ERGLDDRSLVDFASRRIQTDGVHVRSGLDPLTPHDGLDGVCRRCDDVRATYRLLVRVDSDAADLFCKRLRLRTVAPRDSDLLDWTNPRNRPRVCPCLDTGAENRKNPRVLACEQPGCERRSSRRARRGHVRAVHQREWRPVFGIEDADDGLMRLAIPILRKERHELALET